jgi:hypothetical protein
MNTFYKFAKIHAMDYFIICLVAIVGSGLTLFSGFGLGTILLPVFAIFFPIELAIIMTSLVHFSNNSIKVLFFGQHANWKVILKFGIPAIIFALLGAYILKILIEFKPLFQYNIANKIFEVMPLKIIIGILLIIFSLFEVIPKLKNLEFDKKYLPIGGALSGFFGGLSGHQGALRSAFLIRLRLSKEAFIATGVVIACLVDVSRLVIYIPNLIQKSQELDYLIIILATFSAFLGIYFGNKLVQKTTLKSLQTIVGTCLFLFGILLILGII